MIPIRKLSYAEVSLTALLVSTSGFLLRTAKYITSGVRLGGFALAMIIIEWETRNGHLQIIRLQLSTRPSPFGLVEYIRLAQSRISVLPIGIGRLVRLGGSPRDIETSKPSSPVDPR